MVLLSAYRHVHDPWIAPLLHTVRAMSWIGDPVWLPEVLRAEGLEVREYPGWRDRGHGDFGRIWGVVAHHTGSFGETPRGIAEHPELGLASQLHLSQDGIYTICGVGIAWHAGQGSWPGLPTDAANQYTIGIEAANDGTSGWSPTQYDAYVRGVAAILRRLEQDSSHVIGHREWYHGRRLDTDTARRLGGKWDPGGIDLDEFRADVQERIDGGPTGGEDDMPSADDIAKAVWAHRPTKPDGKTDATAGEMLAWTDQHAGLALDQLAGPKSKDQRGPLDPTRWSFLAGRSVPEALGLIGEKLGIPGFSDPLADEEVKK